MEVLGFGGFKVFGTCAYLEVQVLVTKERKQRLGRLTKMLKKSRIGQIDQDVYAAC